jgi:photosystem II stability/assembly factor-like uncharacterized protein
MGVLIGTREGMFVIGQSSAPMASEGVGGRGVHAIRRVNGGILAGTDDGVYRSSDAGRSWQPSGCAGRIIREIAPAPRDARVVYAGTQPAGLYRSDDGGHAWAEIDSLGRVPGAEHWGLPNDPTASRALAIAFDPAQPARYWVGVEVGGILETSDDGATWRATLVGQNPDIHGVVRDPARPDVLYATTGFGRVGENGLPEEKSPAGVYRSDDGGSTWRYVWGDSGRRYTRPLCIDPRAPHAVTVGCAPTFRSSYHEPGGAQSMVYQTTDGGSSWRALGDSAHSPSAANVMALTPAAEESGGVLVGTDNGEVWRVSAEAEWTLIASGLPLVQALLPVD